MSNNKDFKVKNGIKPTVYHEAVGTVVSGSVGYSIAAASYDSKSFSVATQEGNSRSLFIKPDGLSFYITGVNNDTVYQYTMSTAWDISTGSYASKSFSVAGQDTLPSSLFFKPDGTKMYMLGDTGNDVNQYTLSTAWDISTASFDSVVFSVASQEAGPYDLQFKSDGTKMYVSGSTNKVYQYTLSTAWDVSTASYDSSFADVSSTGTSIQSTTFNADGTSLFVSYTSTQGVIYEYTLSTAWDVSTASYASVSFTPSESITGAVVGLTFGDSGSKMYLMDYGTDLIYQYSTVQNTATLDLSTGSVFELTPTSDIQVSLSNPAASGTVSGATLLLDGVATSTYDIANAIDDSTSVVISQGDIRSITMGNSGTKLYIGSATGNSVYQYSLSTAYDATTATYDSVSYSHSSQATNFQGLAFKSDGTKMYGASIGTVYQYSLSTPWAINTASYDTVNFSSSTGTIFELVIKPDGTKFYLLDSSGTLDVRQYTMSTAWNMSTASYDSVSFVVSSQDTDPTGLAFSADGTKMFVAGNTNNAVYQYSLSTPWDLSTASYANISYNYGAQVETSVFFNNNGTKMFVAEEGGTQDIRRFTTGFPATITYDTSIQWAGGTAPTSPAIGETDVLTFSTRDGGTTYNAALAIDGAQ